MKADSPVLIFPELVLVPLELPSWAAVWLPFCWIMLMMRVPAVGSELSTISGLLDEAPGQITLGNALILHPSKLLVDLEGLSCSNNTPSRTFKGLTIPTTTLRLNHCSESIGMLQPAIIFSACPLVSSSYDFSLNAVWNTCFIVYTKSIYIILSIDMSRPPWPV